MKKLFYTLLILIPHILNAQNIIEMPLAINDTGDEADASAILDVQSSTQGVLFPRMSYEEIKTIESPVNGLMIYDTEFNCLRLYNGVDWICLFQAPEPGGATGNYAAIQAGGTATDAGISIVLDSLDQSIIMVGQFSETITLKDSTFTSTGDNDILIAKFSGHLELEWAQNAGGTGDDVPAQVGVDDLGNIYLTGYFNGTASYGDSSITSLGGQDIFIAKYDKDGIIQWVRSAGGTSSGDAGYGLTIDNTGDIVITGRYSGTATFETTNVTAAGGYDIFIAKYSKTGSLKWIKSAGSSSSDYGNAVASDQSKYIVVTGYFSGTASFGSSSVTSTGSTDIFVARYTPSGSLDWVESAGSVDGDAGTAIITDDQDDIYLTGYFQDVASFGLSSLTSNGSHDIFIAKYTSGGSLEWVNSGGSSSAGDYGQTISLDTAGYVFVAGYTDGDPLFEAIQKEGIGDDDIFLAKYSPEGEIEWVDILGGLEKDVIFDIQVSTQNQVIMTGYFEGITYLKSSTLQSLGTQDILLVKYAE